MLISKLPFVQRKATDFEARGGTDRAGIVQPREEVQGNLSNDSTNVYEQVMGTCEKEGVGLITCAQWKDKHN